ELVGQLAHVAGKWVAGEERQRLRRRSLDVLSNLRGHAPHEMARERGHVLEPLAERRDADREDAEPVVEVLAEPAGLHLVLEAAVRRRDDAHVDLPGVIVPDLPDLAVLEDAEQLRLELGRGLRDLVEEERAAVGYLEEALAVRDRAREGAAAVTEE